MEEIVKIIEACGKNGVSHFKMGEVEINFNGFVKHTKSDYAEKVESITESEVIVDPNLQAQVNYELQQEEVENLLITDPLAYEELMMNSDNLEDSETHTDSLE